MRDRAAHTRAANDMNYRAFALREEFRKGNLWTKDNLSRTDWWHAALVAWNNSGNDLAKVVRQLW